MTSLAYPTVYAAVYTVARTAFAGNASVRVVDGYDLSDDPSNSIQLGTPNLTDTQAISEGAFDQEQIGHGASGVIKETGSINGIALAWNGDGDPQAARVAVAGFLDTIGAAIRADRTLAVTDFPVAAWMSAHGEPVSDKVRGATCAISFTVNYTAHI